MSEPTGVTVTKCENEDCKFNVGEACTHGEGITIDDCGYCNQYEEKDEDE